MKRTFQIGRGYPCWRLLLSVDRTLERRAEAQQAGRPPQFDVDPFWPKMPEQWILGQVAGVAIDAQDHVWILQRPWSLNSDEKAGNPEAKCCREAPPVMEFDAAGNYLQGWGGDGPGYEWPKDEHAITVDYKGNVWISSAGGPRLREQTENQILKFTRDGKFLLQVGHARPEQGQPRHRQLQQRRRHLRLPEDQRGVRRRRLRQPPRHRPRRRHGCVQADVGRVRQHAGRQRPEHVCSPRVRGRSSSTRCTASACRTTASCMSPIG